MRFLSHPRSVLLTVSGLFIGAVVLTWAVFSWNDHSRSVEDTEYQLDLLSKLIEEHTLRTVETVDLVLQRARVRVEEIGLQDLLADSAAWSDVAAMARLVPGVDSMWLVDAAGNARASSLRSSVGSVMTVAEDRPYFRAHAEQGVEDLYIGEMLTGRISGSSVFSLSHRLTGPDGQFLGVIALGLRLAYFEEFFQRIGTEPGTTVSLLRADGTMLIRHPRQDGITNRVFPSMAEGLTPENPVVLIQRESPVDGTFRMGVRRLVEDYPLIVNVSLPAERALAGWKARFRNSAFLVAAMLLGIGCLTIAGLRGLRRETVMQATLRETNTTLERTVADRTVDLVTSNLSLEKALREKNALLREVYHRVRNNLQVVEALLALQTRDLQDADAQTAFMMTRRRIHALGLVHQRLLQSEDLATLDLGSFLQDLCRHLPETLAPEASRIDICFECGAVVADIDFAIPLGLLVTELLSDIFARAAPHQSSRTILVRLRPLHDEIELCIIDKREGAAPPVLREPAAGSAGYRVVRALLSQLNGVITAGEGGTWIAVSMPIPESAHWTSGTKLRS